MSWKKMSMSWNRFSFYFFEMNFIKTRKYLKIEHTININKGPVFNFVHLPNDIQIALRQSVEDYGP